MNGCIRNGLNDFCRTRCNSVRPAPLPIIVPCCEQPHTTRVYGSVYQSGSKRFDVRFPGETVPISFNRNAALSAIIHAPESSEIGIERAGDYEIRFSLNVRASSSVYATFELKAGGENLPGGVFGVPLGTNIQTVSGSTMATLRGNDIVQLTVTAPCALSVILDGANVCGTLAVNKLDG